MNIEPLSVIYPPEAFQEAVMTSVHGSMADRPESDAACYKTGWTISGLAVLVTIVAVWILGI